MVYHVLCEGQEKECWIKVLLMDIMLFNELCRIGKGKLAVNFGCVYSLFNVLCKWQEREIWL